jgi:FkbM family methyltransferase
MLNRFPGLKKNIFGFLRKRGVELKRYNLHTSERALISHIIKHHGIDLIVDVGANVGDYVNDLYEDGYSGHACSFEPVKEVFAKLTNKSKHHSTWKALNIGVGSAHEQKEIHVSGNLASSSLLQVTDKSVKAEPTTRFVRHEKIEIKPLDLVSKEEQFNIFKKIFVKIDVQGYEMEVLKGAQQFLPSAYFIQMELSLVQLYEGAPDYLDVIRIMNEKGFDVFTLIPGFRNPETGQMLQADGVFINRNFSK